MQEDNELRLVPGDELRLRYSGDAAHPAWQTVGHVVSSNFLGFFKFLSFVVVIFLFFFVNGISRNRCPLHISFLTSCS